MDLNALYYHQQLAIMHGAHASAGPARRKHSDLTNHYAKRIRAERERLGFLGPDWQEAPTGTRSTADAGLA